MVLSNLISAEILFADMRFDKLKNHQKRLNITIYAIAILLVGLGVITFISANNWIWELLNSSDIVKVALMTMATLGTLWSGYELRYTRNNFPKLGNALIVLSTFLLGGTYALIGQVYNFNANSSFLMFIWVASIVPLAYIFKNTIINITSIILFSLGIVLFYGELALDNGYTWSIFIPVLLGLFLYSLGNLPVIFDKYNDFSLSYKIFGLIPVFITLLVLTSSVANSYNLISIYYILPLILIMFLNFIAFVFQKHSTTLLKIETVFILIISIFLLLLLVLPKVSIPLVILIANLVIISTISLSFYYGYKFENSKLITLTNFFLIIYLIINYCRWGWSYMDKSLFFILGGTILFGIGLFVERKKKDFLRK